MVTTERCPEHMLSLGACFSFPSFNPKIANRPVSIFEVLLGTNCFLRFARLLEKSSLNFFFGQTQVTFIWGRWVDNHIQNR